MKTLTRNVIAGIAMAGMFGAIAPAPADARPPKHVRKAIEKQRKHHKKMMKRYDKRWDDRRHYRPYGYYPRPYKPKTRKHESERFHIFTTPGGGLGFSYSESEHRYPSWY